MPINDTRIVYLNVGGKVYTTSAATLKKFPDSELAKMVSEGFIGNVDEKGNYFIDRDGKLFRHILNFLREPEDLLPVVTGDLQVEARYYGLLGSMFPYIPHTVEASVRSIHRENLIGQEQGSKMQWVPRVDATVVITRDDCGMFFISSLERNLRTVRSPSPALANSATAGDQTLQFSNLPLAYCPRCRLLNVVLLPEQHNVTIVTHPQKTPVEDRRLLLRVHAEQLNNGTSIGYKIFHDQCGACQSCP